MNNSDIEKLYNDISAYQQEHGEDKTCLLAKAQLYEIIEEYSMALNALTRALAFEPHDADVLFYIASVLEKMGDSALASVYYARCACEMKSQNNLEGHNEITASFENAPQACREIFDTVMHINPRTFVYLSNTSFFGDIKQRFESLSTALGALGNNVIFVTNENLSYAKADYDEKTLADYSISHAEEKDGITVIMPVKTTPFGVSGYAALIERIADIYPNAVFITSNPASYEALLPLKGRRKIIFDCVDDTSDYTHAYWTSRNSFLNEQRLVRLADSVLCTAASLFLKKSVIANHPDVYLSPNAVSALEMRPNEKWDEPEDLKNIPHPRIGYVGVIYQRFDRDLLYTLAKNNPDKSFVIVGLIQDNFVSPIYDNIYILGPKKHSELGGYYRNFDVGIIPYLDNAKMSMACDPVKIHEHICCSLPTITTFMPDTAVGRPLVYHANTAEGFQKHIDNILSSPKSITNDERDIYLAENSWISRACQVMRIAADSVYDYERPQEILNRLRNNFFEIRDLHTNFGIIYGITCWNTNPDEAKKYISDAFNKAPTDFNTEIYELFQSTAAKSNISKVGRDECTGCGACLNICPVHAISAEYDELGFFYPKVDNVSCTDCGACTQRCHILNTLPISEFKPSSYCFSMQASDDLRLKASSGGVFPVLALQTVKKGGYVAGAVLDKSFGAMHIVSNSISDVNKMFGSKYTESRLGNTFAVIKKLLDEGKTVLFSGTPCQAAGLNSYLGKSYEKLTIVSVICHGVPSPDLLKQHIENIAGSCDNVIKLSFRDKFRIGCGAGLCLTYGKNKLYAEAGNNDTFTEGFLCDLYLRESCYNCRCKSDINSDLTLGDFWGIQELGGSDDGLGVSYVSVNSDKGKRLMDNIGQAVLNTGRYTKDRAVPHNPSIRASARKPLCRTKFLENIKKHSFDEAYDLTFGHISFDASLVLWFSCNYGNSLTNYALYHTLTEALGLNVLVVDSLGIEPNNQFKDFAEKYFKLSSKYFPKGQLRYLTACCDNFIVGSDQVWNRDFSVYVGNSGYFQLSFIPDDKNKVSYGSSFGKRQNAVVPGKESFYTDLYKRFNHISVREKFGVELLNTVFGVNGRYVLDPIFLPPEEAYLKLAENALVKTQDKYVLTYFLQPSAEKLAYADAVAAKLGDNVKVINIIDADPALQPNCKAFFSADRIVEPHLSPEDFLYYFIHSEYIITDSYHGTCFSIILKKRFTAFIARENDRFETFAEFGLSDRVLSTAPDTVDDSMLESIDFSVADSVLNSMRDKSIKYLKDSLGLPQ